MKYQISSRHRRRRHLHRFRHRRQGYRRHQALQGAVDALRSDQSDRERPEADCGRLGSERRTDRFRLRSLHQRHDGRPQRADHPLRRQDRPHLHRGSRGFDRNPQRSQGRRLSLRSRISVRGDACAALSTPGRARARASRMALSSRRCTRTTCAPPASIFFEEGVETVAISFIWSVLNPVHERRAAEIVRDLMPGVILTVGSELYPQVREYTRTSTAVVNAYLGAGHAQVRAGGGRLFPIGSGPSSRFAISNPTAVSRSGRSMTDRSVYAINSGPASAPQAGLFVCAPFKKNNIITVDMGGTSFDITLDQRRPNQPQQEHRFPSLSDWRSDDSGRDAWRRRRFHRLDRFAAACCRSARRSPARSPGPACYGQGGEEPTISDANLVLGYLEP